MKITLARALAIVFGLFLLFPAPNSATCAGDGGGGTGGMGGTRVTNESYRVPWKVVQPSDPPLGQGLAVYWIPSSPVEFDESSLRFSRILSVYSQQCVTMRVADV